MTRDWEMYFKPLPLLSLIDFSREKTVFFLLLGLLGQERYISKMVVKANQTHTVFGESGNPGIIPLSLKGLFEAIEDQKASVLSALYFLMAES